MSVFYLIYLHNNNIGTLALIVVVSHVSIYLMSLSIKSNIYYSVKITSWCFVLQWSATIFANLRSSLSSNPTENVYNCLGYIFFCKIAQTKLLSNPPERRQPIGLSDINLLSIA